MSYQYPGGVISVWGRGYEGTGYLPTTSRNGLHTSNKLVSACKSGDVSLALYFLESGYADINCTSDEGLTPLNAALSYKRTEVAISLLNIPGININKTDPHRRTPLYFACYNNFTEVIRQLGTHPGLTSVNTKDVYGRSPIMVAVEWGNVEAVKEMLKLSGVDLNTVNSERETLTDVARNNGFPGILAHLRNTIAINSSLPAFPVPALVVEMDHKTVPALQTLPPLPVNKTLTDLEELEYHQEGELKVLELKHAKELGEQQEHFGKVYEPFEYNVPALMRKELANAERNMNKLEKITGNHRKESQELDRKHRQDRLNTLTELKTTHPSPECPVCLEDMPPPTQIFHCLNGHLVCGTCRPSLGTCSFCRKDYMGRAIGMEQFLRSLHNTQ
eukprot:GFUD01004212.1.p1 GENE.GFUD01004212.1~~GFUD01004212.1.p1  ORF type:complete len:389 (+),score=57.51 GFUD01004212.1:28-1194(+)